MSRESAIRERERDVDERRRKIVKKRQSREEKIKESKARAGTAETSSRLNSTDADKKKSGAEEGRKNLCVSLQARGHIKIIAWTNSKWQSVGLKSLNRRSTESAQTEYH